MTRLSPVALLAIGVALTGCSGAETYAPSDPRLKIDGFYNDGVGDRDIKLVVYGNPFGVPNDVFDRQLEADLVNTAMIQRSSTRPLLNPGPSAKPLYRLVYAFDQPNSLYGNVLCQAPPSAATPAPPMHTVTATAAFCVGGEAETFISGQTEADGPADARFYRLARQMMDEVFRPDLRQEASPPPAERLP